MLDKIYALIDTLAKNPETRLIVYDAILNYLRSGKKSDLADSKEPLLVFALEYAYSELDLIKSKLSEDYSLLEKKSVITEDFSRKRGCKKGTKKPYLIGNKFAKKQNELETNKNEKQNELETNKNEKQNEKQNELENELKTNKKSVQNAENDIDSTKNQNELKTNKNELENELKTNKNEKQNELENELKNELKTNKNELEKRSKQVKYTADNFKEREKNFYNSLIPFLDKYGKDMLREFFNYWSETNSNYKMRFEFEKTFEVSKRLEVWHKRKATTFNNSNKSTLYRNDADNNANNNVKLDF